jgi:hypothetical protein
MMANKLKKLITSPYFTAKIVLCTQALQPLPAWMFAFSVFPALGVHGEKN